MQRSVEKHVLKTLIYGDIFDYPLTISEILKFLPGKKKSPKALRKYLEESSYVDKKGDCYFLKGRDKIVSVRVRRGKVSGKKIEDARKTIKILAKIPSVKLIGISGGLAMKNSEKSDDTDLFIVASKNTIWTTRALMILYLVLFGKYRKRSDKNFSEKFCLNMFIDEENISLPAKRRDFYTAREIVQLMPIFDRDNFYKKFIDANKWVMDFLPNSLEIGQNNKDSRKAPTVKIFELLNPIAKKAQMLFIKKHMTTETVSDKFLAFHPYDYKKHVTKLYNRGLKKYGISEKI